MGFVKYSRWKQSSFRPTAFPLSSRYFTSLQAFLCELVSLEISVRLRLPAMFLVSKSGLMRPPMKGKSMPFIFHITNPIPCPRPNSSGSLSSIPSCPSSVPAVVLSQCSPMNGLMSTFISTSSHDSSGIVGNCEGSCSSRVERWVC